MVRIGDLVEIEDIEQRKTVMGIVAGGTGTPDQHLYVLVRNRNKTQCHRLYPDAVRILGVVTAGRQHLDHEQARVQIDLDDMRRSPLGRSALEHARMAATERGSGRRRRALPTRSYIKAEDGKTYTQTERGRLFDYNVPDSLNSGQLGRYLAVRDPGETRPSPDAELVRHLDALRVLNPKHYDVKVKMLEGASTQDIADLYCITVEAAKKLRQRAEANYRRVCLDWGLGS